MKYDQKIPKSIRHRYSLARGLAVKRQLVWAINLEDYAELLESACHYCKGKLNPTGIGLDRIDNDRGYFLGNAVPCCAECNSIKGSTLTYNEAYYILNALAAYRSVYPRTSMGKKICGRLDFKREEYTSDKGNYVSLLEAFTKIKAIEREKVQEEAN